MVPKETEVERTRQVCATKFQGRLVVYYESMKRELKTRPTYECRCDERLKTKDEESTHLAHTGLIGELDSTT